MESEIEKTHINSDYFDEKEFLKQIDIIKEASDIAQKKIDYITAHDDNIIRAIEVVETFLKKSHRLCYGGQAINAHLPAKYKFYDSNASIPDYDFFTPQQDKDINTIVKDLRKAGFIDISAREGVHKGTIKIYVDYSPVADITLIDKKLYRLLSKREFKIDGISYLDANTLRMLMYLELSRPQGEVSRWPKVFERLSLFNEFIAFKPCRLSSVSFGGEINRNQLKFVINYIITNKRIFAGADLVELYNSSLRHKKIYTNWIFTTKKPIIFLSSDLENDAKQIVTEFRLMDKKISLTSYSSKGMEIIPSMKVISCNKKNIVYIINETSCHSYFNVPIKNGSIIRIASMDTLITTYFSLGLIDSKFFHIGSMECLANKLVEISSKARKNPDNFLFPFISIKCSGYQPSFPSLIRNKVKRLTERKKKLNKILRVRKNTVKNI